VIVSIILAGGLGTRLWPLSNPRNPKQFLPTKEQNSSFFQTAVKRSLLVTPASSIVTVSSSLFKPLVNAQLEEIDVRLKEGVIFESYSKNTTAAITFACAYIAEYMKGDPLLWIAPTDQVIYNSAKIASIVKQAANDLPRGCTLTLGITPADFKDTHFGYILPGQNLNGSSYHKVESFIEKPHIEYLRLIEQSKVQLLVNSGIFLMHLSTFLNEIQENAPRYWDEIRNIYQNSIQKDGQLYLSEAAYMLDSISIDKMIMEKSNKLLVQKLDIEWYDIGTWDRLWSYYTNDKQTELILPNIFLDHFATNTVKTDSGRYILSANQNALSIKKIVEV
jgi:mannose-1-phosphate guanylyltransferase